MRKLTKRIKAITVDLTKQLMQFVKLTRSCSLFQLSGENNLNLINTTEIRTKKPNIKSAHKSTDTMY